MIVFIDESYKQDSAGTWHYALAGFGINEFRYRALQAGVYQLIRKYFDVSSNYRDAATLELALKERIIVARTHEHLELKAQSLLSTPNLRRFGGSESPHCRLAGDILSEVKDCRGTCFGVLVNPIDPKRIKDCSGGCPITYTTLISVVGRWMMQEYPGQAVVLALDTEHNGVNLPLSRSIADFLYKTAAGHNMRHIFPSPFWIDSRTMAGSQVADLVAHILMNSMMPAAERKPLDGIVRQVFNLQRRWDRGAGGTLTPLRR